MKSRNQVSNLLTWNVSKSLTFSDLLNHWANMTLYILWAILKSCWTLCWFNPLLGTSSLQIPWMRKKMSWSPENFCMKYCPLGRFGADYSEKFPCCITGLKIHMQIILHSFKIKLTDIKNAIYSCFVITVSSWTTI